jgi:hypothetical protein
VSVAFVIVGSALAVVGVGLLSPAAMLVVAGGGLVAWGLLREDGAA